MSVGIIKPPPWVCFCRGGVEEGKSCNQSTFCGAQILDCTVSIRGPQPAPGLNHSSQCHCFRGCDCFVRHLEAGEYSPQAKWIFLCLVLCPWSTPISFLRDESKYLCHRRNEAYLSVSGGLQQHYMEAVNISEVQFSTWENDSIPSTKCSFIAGLRHHRRRARANGCMGVLFSLCFFKHYIPLTHCCSIYYFNTKGPLSLLFVHILL